MSKFIKYFLFPVLLGASLAAQAVDADSLLPAEQAFRPTVVAEESNLSVQFNIADGYYLYQEKISAETEPAGLLKAAEFPPGKEKEDEFFGKQIVHYNQAVVKLPYQNTPPAGYRLTLSYQGCASVGVCYPPVTQTFDIKGPGIYNSNTNNPADSNRFTAPAESQPAISPVPQPNKSPFSLSRDTLGASLLAFFGFGIGLSFTACMYPLLPIVSGIIVGDRANAGKRRGLILSAIYVQRLALTYATVGVLAGLTGSLLTV